MFRRLLRVAFVGVAVLTGLCAAAVLGIFLWLHTDGGQRFVLERLRAPLRTAGIDLDADRVSGPLFSGLQLGGVTVRACAQKIAVQARSVDVRYGLLALIRGAPELTVTVDAPVVGAVDDAACAHPLPSGGEAPSLPRRVVLRRVEIHDGAVGSGSGRLTAIELVGDGVVERDHRGAPALTFHLARASGRILSANGKRNLELSGHVTPEHVDLELTVSVTRDDLARHAAGAASAGPVALRVHLSGPPDAPKLQGQLTTALGDADLSGKIDVPRRRAELALETRRVVIAPPGSDVEIGASGRVRVLVAAGDKHAARVTLRGRGDYTRRGFDPSLAGAAMRRHPEKLPGGSWSGDAEGSVDSDGLAARFHIDLSSDGKRELAPADVVLSGRLVVPRAGRPRLEANVEPREAGDR